MKGLLFLLCCIEILCAAQGELEITTADLSSSQNTEVSSLPETQTISTADSTIVASTKSTTVSKSLRPPPTPGPKRTTTTTITTTTSISAPFFYRKECVPVFMVAGGLIIACFILLLSTVFLMFKVCQLNRRIKMLSSNADLISTNEYWMGTAQRNKNTSEAEAKETTVLMSDVSQTQEDMGNGTTKEEGGKVDEDGPTGEEKKKEVEDTVKSEEASPAPVTAAENAPSTKPQEDSKSAEAVAASEGTEEPKGVV